MRSLADPAAASSPDMDAKPPSTAAPGARRPVRSYVLRQGRMSAAQRSAYDTLYARYCLAYQTTPIDLDQAYGRRAPKILEIGFGMGEVTAAIAAAHPEQDFLGIEVHTPGVGALLKLVNERRLENIRIIQHDAIEVLQHMIAPAALSGVNIFFPDPWPKKRHHKRRLIQPEFARLIAQRVRSGGTAHLATDWEDYAQQMLAVLSADPDFVNVHDAFAPSAGARPRTRFESKGRKAGHQIWDLEFRRR